MTGLTLQISSKSIGHSSVSIGTKNAWARYVRNRWHQNSLGMIQREWDLTEGEARGLLYAQASQSTIDKVLCHPRGGFALGLEILALVTGTTLESFIAEQAQQARREREQWEARQRTLELMEAAISVSSSEFGGLDR